MEHTPHKNNSIKNKNMIVIGIVLLIVVGIVVWLLTEKDVQKTTEKTPAVIKNAEIIPTVDASVQVDLAYSDPRKKVKLSVKGIPVGTTVIEYSINYDLSNGGLQGFQGELQPEGKTEAETDGKNLGTCSSGVCRYDDVTGHMKVDMKFTGSYGERLFEKEFQL